MAECSFEVGDQVYLGLHRLGHGDLIVPSPARYDGQAYCAEFVFDDSTAATFQGAPTQAYDAITVYNSIGQRLDLLPLSRTRSVRLGDSTRARVEMNAVYRKD